MDSPIQHLLLLLLTALSGANAQRLLGIAEGGPCPNGGMCTKIKNCPHLGDIRVVRPTICSFEDRDPIICCPPPSTAVSMCARYDSMACNIIEVNRRKRASNDTTKTQEEANEASNERKDGGGLFLYKVVDWLFNLWGGCGGATEKEEEAEGIEPRFGNEVAEDSYEEMLNSLGIEPSSPKVIGGYRAAPRELPFMALIGYGRKNEIEWSCGGTIISDQFILTAAHCLKAPMLGPARWVRVGELDLSTAGDDARPRDLEVLTRHAHPGYKEPAVYNDIALLRLSQPIEFSHWIQPICLHPSPVVQQGKAVAAGWGRTDFVGPTSEDLKKVELSLVEGKECTSLLGRVGRFLPQGVNTDSMICAGEKLGGKDTCTGDSGGPLFVAGNNICLRTQIGIISFGRQCALPNMPAIYTKVSHFIPWIESVVWP